MKKCLLIEYGYKEVHNASAQIARTFWEHIPEDEFQPTIVCAGGDWKGPSRWPIIEIRKNRLLHVIFVTLRRLGLNDLTMIPDIEYYSWNPFAYKRIKKLLDKQEFDYIHVISSPQSSHLLGLSLKKKAGIPLIIQCNDPWHDTSGRRYKYKWCAKRDLKYEKLVAEGADVVIHSNNVIADIWHERYGEKVFNKIRVVPFSFNIHELPEISSSNGSREKLIISHIGNIYSTRSSLTIFQGVEQLIHNHPECRDKFEIYFIGIVHQSEIDYVREHELNDCIKHIGKIAPDSLKPFYINSDIFMLIDVVIKRNPNYPSKLMMYYYYRKPIWGLTTPNSNLAEELQSSGHSVCYYDDSIAVAEYLYKAITEYDSLLKFNHDFWKKHIVKNVRGIYNGILLNDLNIK